MFGSRWLTSQLSTLGFSVSTDEVMYFKQSVLENGSMELKIDRVQGSFTQWSADNIDHNLQTTDSKASFHVMSIISSTTNQSEPVYPTVLVPIKWQKLKKV